MILLPYFDLIRGLHIVAVIAWMAGMMYLPRLFAYHTRAKPGSEMAETFKVMEARLLRMIINPAMVLVFVLGGTLIWVDLARIGPHFWVAPWFLTKIGGVILLSAWHGYLARARRMFAQDRNTRSERFWRMTNELPFLVAIVIVIAATTKFGLHG
ncbi:MAG TPA: CopD family protein [Caulobacteraceae bacterium]|nr:CopD family protein [Caulobacteraceae bacterium]